MYGYLLAFAGTQRANPREDGQAELTREAGNTPRRLAIPALIVRRICRIRLSRSVCVYRYSQGATLKTGRRSGY